MDSENRTILMRRSLPPCPPASREYIDELNASGILAVQLPYRDGATEDHDVLATRESGREAVRRWDESNFPNPAVLDFEGVDVASPSFLDELHKAWPGARPENMTDDVARSWAMVMERSRTNPALDEDGPSV